MGNPAIEKFHVTDREAWLRLRKPDVTASVAGALLGVHEYQTAFGLWALKSGRISDDPEDSKPMRRGRLLEPIAVQIFREENHEIEILEQGDFYYRDTEIGLGATPDVLLRCPKRGLGVLQIKSVESSIFRQKWRDPDTRSIEPPLWIAVQASVEAYLTGAKWAMIGALVVGHGIELHTVEVPIIPGVAERIREETVAFHALLASGEHPDPDWGRDGAVIERMYSADDGGEIDLSRDNRVDELIAAHAAATAAIKDAEGHKEAIRAELKAKLGDNAVGHLRDGKKLTWKTQHRKGYVVEPSSFRVLRVPSL